MTAPRLRRVAGQAAQGMIVKPLVIDYMMAGRYPGRWQVTFRDEQERRPDGFFHPSSAPVMGERLLYLFLTDPDAWEREPIDYVSRVSMFMGTALGDFLRMALEDMKITIPPKGTCVACGLRQPSQCREHGVIDTDLGSRGHVDGLMPDEVFELKSTASLNLSNAPDMDEIYFMDTWPKYWRQVMEYLRMTRYRRARVLFYGIGNPWLLREYVVHARDDVMRETEEKYRRVRLAVERREMPQPCCAPGSATARSCPASSCPVRRLSLVAR